MKKSKLRKLIRESIKGLMNEQQGPWTLGNLTVTAGQVISIAVAGGANITVPNNLSPQPTPSTPHNTNEELVWAIWLDYGPLACDPNMNGGFMTSCCFSRWYTIYPNNITCIQNNFFTGGGTTPKPGVYIDMYDAMSMCENDYPYGALPSGMNTSWPTTVSNNSVTTGLGKGPSHGCIAPSTPTPPTPSPQQQPILDCADPTATNYNPDPNVIGCDNYSGFCNDSTITGYNPQICAGNTSCCTYDPIGPPPEGGSDDFTDLETDPEIQRMQDLANIR